MRDRRLLATTLVTMRQFGGGSARLVQDGRVSLHLHWYAGPQRLNPQAVRDLVNDGWLRPALNESGDVRIDAWPHFADMELQP